MKKILIIVGSMRKNSFNYQLAKRAEALLDGRAQVSFLEYSDLPFMNQDIEFPAPAAVERVRQQVLAADGIWIFSPEYNYQIPGVLKNLLDWLSRPLHPNNRQSGSAVKGKPVSISAAAGKSAGAGVRKNLAGLLMVMSMELIGGEGLGIVLGAEAFKSGCLLLSDEDEAALVGQLEEFVLAI